MVNLEGYDDADFHSQALEDIGEAQICVRFALFSYTPDGVGRMAPAITKALERGVPVCAYLMIPYGWDERHLFTGTRKREFDKKEEAIEMLKELGVHINMVAKVHRKQIIIDFKTYWRGSLNPMSHAPGFSVEQMERSHDSYKSLEALIRYKMDKCSTCRKLAEAEPPISAVITDAKSVGSIIRANRTVLEVAQNQLAAYLQLEPGQISRIERGQHMPRVDTMCKIFAAMNLKVVVLPEEMVHLVLWLMEQSPKPLKWNRDKLVRKLSLRHSAASLRAQIRSRSGTQKNSEKGRAPLSPPGGDSDCASGLGGAAEEQQPKDSSTSPP